MLEKRHLGDGDRLCLLTVRTDRGIYAGLYLYKALHKSGLSN